MTIKIARDEVFDPLIDLFRTRDEAHAPELTNAGEYGLSSTVFGHDLEHAVHFACQLHAGMIHVNDIPANDEVSASFNDERNSGLDRFDGDQVIEEFITGRWISMQHVPHQYPFRLWRRGPRPAADPTVVARWPAEVIGARSSLENGVQ